MLCLWLQFSESFCFQRLDLCVLIAVFMFLLSVGSVVSLGFCLRVLFRWVMSVLMCSGRGVCVF